MTKLAIWKFPLHIADACGLQMPEGARILALKEQGGAPCLWVLVDPDAPQTMRHFSIYGTGHPLPPNPGTYIGTTIHMDGQLVLHTFEEPPA